MNDLRFAFRQLLKNPGFTAVAVLTLALGIGANTAMFSMLNMLMFRPLTYREPARLVTLDRTSPHSQRWPHSPANFCDYRERNSVFQHLAAYRKSNYNLSGDDGTAVRLDGYRVTEDYFPALGVPPVLGRVFTAEDYQPGTAMVIVLSDSFWRRRFAADTKIIGSTVRLDGQTVTVIGVMPASFEEPLVWGPIDLWRPLAFTSEQRRSDRINNNLLAFGRLKPGVSAGQADAEMKTIAARMGQEHPANRLDSLRVTTMQRASSDDAGRKLTWFGLGLAGFVLLIACANLANLQLVRTAARAREFAIRAALGAPRGRLLRQSLTESVLVSLVGGAFGLLLAQWCNDFASRRLFAELPGASIPFDVRVFYFALAASVLTGIVFGSAPAWLASRADVNDALKDNLRGTTSGRSHHRLRSALIVGEVGFALMLLTGAGLFISGLQRFIHLDPGWRPDGLVLAQLNLKGTNYAASSRRAAFFARLEERLAALPGGEKVGFSETPPIFPFGSSYPFEVEGRPIPPGQPVPEVFAEAVSVKHFETLGMRVLEGRGFTAADTENSPRVVVINQTMARSFWPNESAIGKRIGVTVVPDRDWKEIVGVVNDVHFPAFLGDAYTRFQSYEALAQAPGNRINISLRGNISVNTAAASLRRIVGELDRDQSVFDVRDARELINARLGGAAVLGRLLGAFAAIGLVLAVIGIYGVTSYSMLQRTSEIGIRMALGAQRRDVLWLVLSKGLRLSLFGALLGLGGAWAVSRLLTLAMPSLPSKDPVTFAAVTIGLMGAAVLASYLPAHRATKVNPLEALRHE
jgi:putative ABC transport system permease protein